MSEGCFNRFLNRVRNFELIVIDLIDPILSTVFRQKEVIIRNPQTRQEIAHFFSSFSRTEQITELNVVNEFRPCRESIGILLNDYLELWRFNSNAFRGPTRRRSTTMGVQTDVWRLIGPIVELRSQGRRELQAPTIGRSRGRKPGRFN